MIYIKTIDKDTFIKYDTLADKVITMLCDENMSTIRDVEIIFHIIRGYPYCLNEDGHYTYHGEYYESVYDLPVEALEAIQKYGIGAEPKGAELEKTVLNSF